MSDDLLMRLDNPPFGTETSERNLFNAAAACIRELEAENQRLSFALAETEALEAQHDAVIDRLMAEDRYIRHAAIQEASGLMLQWRDEAAASIDTGHPSGMNVARENERDWAQEAADAIRALIEKGPTE